MPLSEAPSTANQRPAEAPSFKNRRRKTETDENQPDGPWLAEEFFDDLPQYIRDQALHDLRSGYSATIATNTIFEHCFRGPLQQLDYKQMFRRVKYVLDYHVMPYKDAKERRREERKLYSSPEECPDLGNIEFEEGDTTYLVSKLMDFPPFFLELSIQLLLLGESTQTVSQILMRHADNVGLEKVSGRELAFRLEFLRQFANTCVSRWRFDHPDSPPDIAADFQRVRQMFIREDRKPPNKDREPAKKEREPGYEKADGPHFPSYHFPYGQRRVNLLVKALSNLPPELHQQVTSRLSSGVCSESVTNWLVQQPNLGVLQELSERDLLYLIEAKRRRLFYGFGDPLSDNREGMHKTVTANLSTGQGKQEQSERDDATKWHSLLLWHLAQLPAPLFDQFTQVLKEGIAERVVRLTARINGQQANTGPDNGPAQPEGNPPDRLPSKDALEKSESSFRVQKGEGMLRTLGKLEPALLAEVMKLLAFGAKATVVARFILSQPDSPNSPLKEHNTARQYVQHLRHLLLAETTPPSARRRFVHRIAKRLQKQHARTRLVQLARQRAESPSGDPGAVLPLEELGSSPRIKAALMELFWGDFAQTVAKLKALRGKYLPAELV